MGQGVGRTDPGHAGNCALTEPKAGNLPPAVWATAQERPAILVVDDVMPIVRELVTMLNLMEMPARGARSISEALAVLIDNDSLRIVACDVRLNGESGADLVLGVRQNPSLADRNIHFVFMTGDAMQYDSATPIHGYPVLMKPVPPAVLVSTLSTLLKKGQGA